MDRNGAQAIGIGAAHDVLKLKCEELFYGYAAMVEDVAVAMERLSKIEISTKPEDKLDQTRAILDTLKEKIRSGTYYESAPSTRLDLGLLEIDKELTDEHIDNKRSAFNLVAVDMLNDLLHYKGVVQDMMQAFSSCQCGKVLFIPE